MHEYAIISELINRVEGEARNNRAARVERITVRLGEMAGVDRALFETAFTVFTERTMCEGAELVIEPVKARWACPKCQATIERGAALSCVLCGRPAALVEGSELILQRIEMEACDV